MKTTVLLRERRRFLGKYMGGYILLLTGFLGFL